MASSGDDDDLDLERKPNQTNISKLLQNKSTCFHYGPNVSANDAFAYQLPKTQTNDIFLSNLLTVLNRFPTISLKEPRPNIKQTLCTKNYSEVTADAKLTKGKVTRDILNAEKSKITRKVYPHLNDEQKDLNLLEKTKTRYVDMLETLCSTDLTTFPLRFSENKRQFLEFLSQINNLQDKIPETVEVISKICNSDNSFKNDLLPLVITSEFIENLVTYIALLPSDYNETTFQVNGITSFFHNLLTFCEAIIVLLPLKVKESARNILKSIQYSITALKDCELADVDHTFSAKILELLTKLSVRRDEARMQICLQKKDVNEQEMVPPEHIKKISILPTKEDLFASNTFLRKNLIRGSYKNVEHYIDVQFRLLREDFIAPLRNGIQLYHKQLVEGNYDKNNHFDNIRIHEDVRILHGTFADKRFGHLVQLNKSINCNTKRFMFGSLILLTSDNFKTFFCATVITSTDDNMLIVELQVSPDLIDGIYHNHYTMIETEIYFEPYLHVLRALQDIDEKDFPMKSYIVDVCSERDNSESFPDSECPISLNESQKKAFKAAMANNFVAIQGPPGTGKTFLALEITKRILFEFGDIVVDNRLLLLKNDQDKPEEYVKPYKNYFCIYEKNLGKKYFHDFFCENTMEHSPILVVCYTNHALDQFLKELLDTTLKCVRVGGQSKNSSVLKFNIKEIRSIWMRREKYARRQCKCRMCVNQLSELKEHVLKRKIMGEITFSYLVNLKLLEVILTKGLLNVRYLARWMPPQFRATFRRANQYEHWLFENISLEKNCFNHQVDSLILTSNSQHGFVGPAIVHTNQLVSELRKSSAFLDELEIDGLSELEAEKSVNARFSITIEDIQKEKKNLQRKVRELRRKRVNASVLSLYEDQVKDLELQQRTIAYYLNKKFVLNLQRIRELRRTQNVFSLNQEDRCFLYLSWVERLKEHIQQDMSKLEREVKDHQDWFISKQNTLDLKILRSAKIIGMTTTGAARLRNLIERVRPTVVIVEEAAEVLEAHVVSALSTSVKKVILIGDHKQLRPSAAVYKLAKEYNLDISLFERLVNNGIACYVLDTQLRMRPEISSLIVPAIYPVLKNHDKVKSRPDIAGVAANVFFVTHNCYEDEIPESTSRRNYHEVNFISSLCEYLLQQGYLSTDITILATYAGQMTSFEMERSKRKWPSDLRITTVDNYQGEESNIILLSLVRSNAKARIGFLSAENRVCVALSRARNGLFVIGNMENLTRNSDIWPKIKVQLEKSNAIGPALSLGCKDHPASRTSVSKGSDFKGIPNSGCKVKCDAKLNCGHICQKFCHSLTDPRHEYKFTCRKPCERMICKIHICKKPCGDKCEEFCDVLVEKTLSCGHSTQMLCGMNPEKEVCKTRLQVKLACGHTASKYCYVNKHPRCEVPCTFTLDCGHQCDRLCHTDDHNSANCKALIKKELICGHVKNVQCNQIALLASGITCSITCQEPCKRQLQCGHHCMRLCGDPCDRCETLVEKTLPCGHDGVSVCSMPAHMIECRHPCERQLPCGHPCLSICSATCFDAACEEYVLCSVEPACGHDPINLPCHLNSQGLDADHDLLLQHCKAPCRDELPCGHTCTGRCGDCLQGRLHMPCQAMCNKTLPCGHSCEEECGRECPIVCPFLCLNGCSHRPCPDPCGQPCSPCLEPCSQRCAHRQCLRQCSLPCSTAPCGEPCYQTLRCGHPCPGYCGSPCPKHCVICQPDEFRHPGYEPQSTHRFVLLENCGHSIETKLSKTLITTMLENNNVGKCPICNAPVVQISRFKHEIREIFSQLSSMKKHREDNLAETLRNVRRKVYQLKQSQDSLSDDLYGDCAASITEHLKRGYHVNQTSDWVISLFGDIKDVMAKLARGNITACLLNESNNATKDLKLIMERCKLLLKALSLRQESMSACEYEEVNREVHRVKIAAKAWPDRRPLLVTQKKMSLDQMLRFKV